MKTVLSFQAKRLRSALDALPPRARAIFAALCARRLSHLYTARHAQDPAALQTFATLHDQLWGLATNQRSSPEAAAEAAARALAVVQTEVEEAEPLAEDAAAALVYALRVLQNGDAQDAVWAAERAYDALYTFLQTRGVDPDAEDVLSRHPLIQAELTRQADDLRELRGADTARESQWDDLRNRADAAAQTMFG